MIRSLAKANVHSAELEMTVNMLIQIDKLVQLLESPVFTCMVIMGSWVAVANLQQTFACSFWSQNGIRICTSVSTAYSCYCLNPLRLQR